MAILWGGVGADTLTGGAEDNTIGGDAGNDRLTGNSARDQIFGGDGDDTITGAGGNDYLEGGAGRALDTVVGPQNLRSVGKLDQLERHLPRVRGRERNMPRRMPVLGEHDVLEAAGQLSEGVLAPLNRVGDTVGARFENGRVVPAPGFKEIPPLSNVIPLPASTIGDAGAPGSGGGRGCGAGGAGDGTVTVTESNVETLRTNGSALVTTSPVLARPETVVEPTTVQACPLLDVEAVTVEPARASLSHAGRGCVPPPR